MASATSSSASSPKPTLVYKILTSSQWYDWKTTAPAPHPTYPSSQIRLFTGAGIDIRDGYIHLSTAGQAGETYDKYFAPPPPPNDPSAEGCGDGQALSRNGEELVVVEIDLRFALGEVKWDPVEGRRGEAFAHVYGGGLPLVDGAVESDWEKKGSAVRRVWAGDEVNRELFARIVDEGR
jgi:uncharacterized protein (DUF952 family)